MVTQNSINKAIKDGANIDGGSIDGCTIATSNITVGAGKTLDVSAGTLTLADNQISGDKVEGGTINAITIGTLTLTNALTVPNGGTGATTLTDHGVLVGAAAGAIQATAAGTATQVLQSGGAAANPVWSTFTIPATFAQGDILAATAANTVTGVTKDANATRYLSNTGATNNPAWAQVNMANGITGTVPVGNGGTGATSYTDGQLLIGNTTGNTLAVATLTAGAGIAITNGSGAITIAASGGGLAWSEVTGATAGAINNGYICNHAAVRVVVTLPDTAAVGSVIQLVGKGAAGFQLAQNAGETVYIGDQATTAGAGGSLASTDAGDCIELVCITESVSWRVVSSFGNITVV